MTSAELLREAFERIHRNIERIVEGLTPDQLAFRPDTEANSVAWLVWHLTRTQDHHLADAFGHLESWTSDGWASRFALPFADSATGNRQTSEEVSAVRVDSGELLTGYHDAVAQQTNRTLETLTDEDFDRIVDDTYDPPVTLAVRLISVVNDNLQHVGQAAYVRGLLERRAP